MKSGVNQKAVDATSRARSLIAVVTDLVRELHGRSTSSLNVTLSSRLDRDLGIDSLGRTELVLRIERVFRIRLPVSIIGEADTVGDILTALEQGAPQQGAPDTRIAIIAEAPIAVQPVVAPAAEAKTMVEALEWHVAQNPDRPHVTVLQDENIVLATMTYGELSKAAQAVAAGLIARDVVPGDRVAVMSPTGTEFFAAFFGILYTGAVPVPISRPCNCHSLRTICAGRLGFCAMPRRECSSPSPRRCGSEACCVGSSVVERDRQCRQSDVGARASCRCPKLDDPAATALIQYTSGSTGDPKGVVLSHANLLANIRAMFKAIDATSAEVLLSWLPLYHDMGLIGAWLAPLYVGARCYIMSPLSFLAHPQSWLWASHRYRATISAAPNFAFELCLKQIDDADLSGLDLSSLRFVANGAESVSVHTLRRFIERFSRYGFRSKAMAPVYGLAECAVALALPPPGANRSSIASSAKL